MVSRIQKTLEYTQRELAQELGVSHSLIYAIEKKGYTPSKEVCKKLGYLLGFDPKLLRNEVRG